MPNDDWDEASRKFIEECDRMLQRADSNLAQTMARMGLHERYRVERQTGQRVSREPHRTISRTETVNPAPSAGVVTAPMAPSSPSETPATGIPGPGVPTVAKSLWDHLEDEPMGQAAPAGAEALNLPRDGFWARLLRNL